MFFDFLSRLREFLPDCCPDAFAAEFAAVDCVTAVVAAAANLPVSVWFLVRGEQLLLPEQAAPADGPQLALVGELLQPPAAPAVIAPPADPKVNLRHVALPVAGGRTVADAYGDREIRRRWAGIAGEPAALRSPSALPQ